MPSPVCKKLVFTSTFFRERHSIVPEEGEQQDEDRELMEDTGSSDSSDSEPDSPQPSSQEKKPGNVGSESTLKLQSLHSDANSSTRTSFLTSEDDISIFKRVLQEIPSNSLFDTTKNFVWYELLDSSPPMLPITEAPEAITTPLYR
jgi:hypothetical protein